MLLQLEQPEEEHRPTSARMQAIAQPPYVLGRPGLIIAGRYRLVSPLGQGAMGEVWRGMHQTLGTAIAVKLVAARSGDEEASARFVREARAAAALKSRHVVGVFDHGSEGGLHYIAMELLEGETLAERIARVGPLSDVKAALIIREIAKGIGCAHQAGVVHRDLKPANVFLTRSDDGEVAKILDFGIAKLASTHGGFQTRSGESMGTPAYMSPEQVMGNDVDYRADLWQVAIIGFECLTGKLPYAASTTGELLSQIATRRLRNPSDLSPQLPRAVDEWFLRATALDRTKRYDSAEKLGEALTRALAAQSIGGSAIAIGPRTHKQQQLMLLAVVVGLGMLALGLLVFVGIAASRASHARAVQSAEVVAAMSDLPNTPTAVSSAPALEPPKTIATQTASAKGSAAAAPSASAKPLRKHTDPWGF